MAFKNSLLSHRKTAIVASVAIALSSSFVNATTIFDPSGGQLPSAQNWNAAFITGPDSTQGNTGSRLTLETTTTITDEAGYFSSDPTNGAAAILFPNDLGLTLDSTTGYTISFGLQVIEENHAVANNRGGFSIIAVSEDTTAAIEIAFWEDEVWAYNAGFSKGESSGIFDTTMSLIQYDLLIQGSSYVLTANNSQILTGSLREYTPALAPSLHPYDDSSMIFFGDNTDSASASVEIGSIELTAVPEPSTYAISMAFIALIAACVRKRMR